LPPHFKKSIQMEVFVLKDFNDEEFNIKVNDNLLNLINFQNDSS
jgi:hypothetical protein